MDTMNRKIVLMNHCRARTETHTENAHVDTELGEEEGRINWEIMIDLYAPPCVNQTASANLPYSPGRSAQRSVMTQVGGMGGCGRETSEGEDVCIHKADELRGEAEGDRIL